MTILWVTANSTAGGAEVVVSTLHQQARSVDDIKSIWVAITSYQTKTDGFIPLYKKRVLCGIWDLVKIIKRERPDRIIFNLMHLNIIGGMMKLIFPYITIIGVEHNVIYVAIENHYTKKLLLRLMARLSYKLLNNLICVSSGVKNDVVNILGLKPNVVHVINNPIDPRVFKKQVRIPTRPIGYIGSHNKQKNVEELLFAFSRYKKRGGTRNLVIAGKGSRTNVLKDLTNNLSIRDSVQFIGFVDPVYFYTTISTVVVTSKWEGFCNVVAEGILCGCEVIASNCHSGPADIISLFEAGQLYKPGDIETLTEKFLKGDINPNNIPEKINLNLLHPKNVLQKYITI
jgi:glycosyltransferase involved in cell wall biosynthesis